MTEQVIRFSDYEKHSREPDACEPRDPADATIIIMPAGGRLRREALEAVFLRAVAGALG